MEWLLIGLMVGLGLCESGRRQRAFERAEARRLKAEDEEFRAFIASLQTMTPIERENAWRARAQAVIAANQIAAVVAATLI